MSSLKPPVDATLPDDYSGLPIGRVGPTGPAGATGATGATGGTVRVLGCRVSSAGAVVSGSGITTSRLGTGTYTVTFTSAFTGRPAVSAIAEGNAYLAYASSGGSGNTTILFKDSSGTLQDTAFSFTAVQV